MLKDLNLYIISPSSYGDKGELLQYYKILMRNPVFNVLGSLILKAKKKLGISEINIECLDERTQKGEDYLEGLINRQKTAQTNLVFISAKNFELPRAIDIARKLKRAGPKVIIGGPGPTLADWKTLNYLIGEGICFNVGEGENTVTQIINDAINNQLKPFYWQKEYVNMREAPLPILPKPKDYKSSLTKLAGISTSEGCPFNCSFCCITKLRGREISKERSRNPEAVMDWIEKTHSQGLPIMLTDDNFRRSYIYEDLKKHLIRFNEKIKNKLYLLTQIDAASDLMGEIKDLARMGVKHVFMGLESLDPQVLSLLSKNHNRPSVYKTIRDKFHKYGILVSSGVMINFPTQTIKSIKAEMKKFAKILDLAHLFIATPLPGTLDWEQAIKNQELLTFDQNFYNTRHCVRNWFKNMSLKEAQKAYHEAMFKLFSLKHIIGNPRLHLSLWLKNFRNNAYGRILAELGRFLKNKPLHYMMEGIPKKTRVFRPRDSFRGFPLTPTDLDKKESYLTSLT